MNRTTVAAKVVLAAFATLSALAPIYVHADTVSVSRKVSYAGLDLNTAAGAQAFYARLKGAARSLCTTSDPVDRAPSSVYRECMQDALAKVVRAANRPTLTQVFVSDYGVVVDSIVAQK